MIGGDDRRRRERLLNHPCRHLGRQLPFDHDVVRVPGDDAALPLRGLDALEEPGEIGNRPFDPIALIAAHPERRHVDGDERANSIRAAIADVVPGGQRSCGPAREDRIFHGQMVEKRGQIGGLSGVVVAVAGHGGTAVAAGVERDDPIGVCERGELVVEDSGREGPARNEDQRGALPLVLVVDVDAWRDLEVGTDALSGHDTLLHKTDRRRCRLRLAAAIDVAVSVDGRHATQVGV